MDENANILAQLAELRLWHDQHCSDTQLETPDAKILQLLGLSPSFIHEIETSQTPTELNNSITSPKDDQPVDPVERLRINNDLTGTDAPAAVSQPIQKRPFLKRGEGLKSRFKVHPDSYRLKNLPKYKYAGTGKQRPERVQQAMKATEPEEVPTVQSPQVYQERTRKSCLKSETGNTVLRLEDLRVQMTELCTEAIHDDDSRDSVLEGRRVEQDAQVKRMLEFSRKSPKVTFDNAVVQIPFENYFHQEVSVFKSDHEDPDVNGEGDESESYEEEFNLDPGFHNNAVISTPLEIFKEKHLSSSDKSPRTVLVEKGSQLREKLRELEEETTNFREQNRQVQKLKQNLELERVQVQKEKRELEKYFKEEQLKMELHFDKLKEDLDQERVRMEQRSAVPSKKLKEEMQKLRDQIEHLEKELKNRELKHGAAQTRLRTHIRSLEKENKEHGSTIENLKKENKKLETENSRLQRQKNNKMLAEINKNIAKLATPAAVVEEAAELPELKKTTRINNPKIVTQKKPSQIVPKRSPQSVVSIQQSEISDASDSDPGDDSDASDQPTRSRGSSNYFPGQQSRSSNSNAEKENCKVPPLNETTGPKREVVNEDGSKDVYYPNGNLKKVSADGMTIKILYFNKDIKETNINEGTVKYYYAETQTWHTSFLDGLEILEFPSGQTEHRHKNGMVEIHFPNGLVRVTNPRDKEVLEEWRYPDGTIVLETRAKEKVIKMPNGQKEIHTADHKRREYPDGTVKLVYTDGRTETRYCNGRIRIKNKEGQLISDSQGLTA